MAALYLAVAPFLLTVPRPGSGLISNFWARFPVCSGLHTTPVVPIDSRRWSGSDRTPGSFASRCGSAGAMAVSNGFQQSTPGASLLTHSGFYPHGSRGGAYWLMDSKHSVESLGQLSGLLSPLFAGWKLQQLPSLWVKQNPQGSRFLERFPHVDQPWRSHIPAPSLRLVIPGAFDGFSLRRSWYDHRPASIILSRDTGVRLRDTHVPCYLGCNSNPRGYRFPVRSRLTPSSGLTSWLSRQVLVQTLQAACPLSRTALALHSSWIGH